MDLQRHETSFDTTTLVSGDFRPPPAKDDPLAILVASFRTSKSDLKFSPFVISRLSCIIDEV